MVNSKPLTLTREQVRELDRRATEEYGLLGLVLMENAGRGVAELLVHLGVNGPVVICCGTGNNGGDGFVIARHLDIRGIPVRIFLFGDPQRLSPDAALNYRIASSSGLGVDVRTEQTLDEQELTGALAGAGWVIDCLLGTGARGTVRAPLSTVIAAINACGTPVLAADLPSGLDCDTGEPLGLAVRAQHTATFVAPKRGFAIPAAQRYLGQVHVLDIGAPRQLVEQYLPQS